MARNLACKLRSKILADDVATERKRKASLLEPPFAHVGDEVKATVAKGQLPLVDEQSHVHLTIHHHVLDLVERGEHRAEVRLVHPKSEIRAGEGTWDRDPL